VRDDPGVGRHERRAMPGDRRAQLAVFGVHPLAAPATAATSSSTVSAGVSPTADRRSMAMKRLRAVGRVLASSPAASRKRCLKVATSRPPSCA